MDDKLKGMSLKRLDLFSTALKVMKWIAGKPTHKAFNLLEVMNKFDLSRAESYRIMDRIVEMHPGRIVKCKYGSRTLYITVVNLNNMTRRDYDNKHMVIRRLKKLKVNAHKKIKRGENNGL